MAYNQVDTEFHDDTIDWPRDEQDLALYLLTCRYRAQAGLFRIRRDQIAADRRWDQDRVDAALAALTARGWLLYEDGWMLLCKSLRWAPPSGPKQVAGAVSKVRSAPRDGRVWAAFVAAAERWAPDFAAKLDRPETGYPAATDTVSSATDTRSFSTLAPALTQAPLNNTARAGAADATEVETPPAALSLPDDVRAACDDLAAAGLGILDRQIVADLAARNPDVDIRAAATATVRWGQSKRIKHPYNALRSVVEADDAPRKTPSRKSWSGARDLSRFDRPAVSA